MDFSSWVEQGLQGEPSEEGLYYMCRRGMSEYIRCNLGVNIWHPPETPCPDAAFSKSFGEHGEKLAHSLVFPYRDPTGRLVLLEMRDTRTKRLYKYSFTKGQHAHFGGIPWMMPYLWAGQIPIVVEGFFDLVALVRVYRGPVLVAGTADLNQEQTKFLTRWCDTVMLGLDNDSIGRKSQSKLSQSLAKAGLRVLELSYTGYKDPGAVWDQGGQDLLDSVFGQRLPVKGMTDGCDAMESW